MAKENYQPYNPVETEVQIYTLWEKSGYFNPDVCIEKGVLSVGAESFSMVLPPPNVTGTLHTGSALMLAVEDAIVRFNRLAGKKTLWIPGTDHAAIATQSKVEKLLAKEGMRREDLGREKFLARVNDFARNSHDTIVSQIRALGASVDWSRECFTLDEARGLAVRTAFKTMYEAALIYRGFRVVNWDVKGQTTVSDDEVVYEETIGKLYTFRYSQDFPISIATTRPETKVGDTAVAVHPEDTRYQKYLGQTFQLEFCGVPLSIKIVADEAVDPTYGTGAVGITPAHSQIDFELSQKHDLPLIQVINEKGRMMVDHPELKDKKTLEAREWIIQKLEVAGLLEKTEEIQINLSKAQRSGGVIEPLPKEQWFISVNKKFKIKNSKFKTIKDGEELTLKELMQRVVRAGEVEILPERFKQDYFHWIDNLKDWCISRQLWYGHRIPVWHRSLENKELRTEDGIQNTEDGKQIYVGIAAPEGPGWEQEEDTLDTWFSSGLWTFSTLGWPSSAEASDVKPSDLEVYHPTTVLETAYDILFFWVARMILMSGFHLSQVPFRTVYLHGLVRDEKGRKMSKSLDNIVDPVDLIKQYGADALRLAMLFGVGVGSDQNISTEKVKGMRNFVNKLFNISRFVMMKVEATLPTLEKPALTPADEAILEEALKVVAQMKESLEAYRLSDALQMGYDFIWNRFASEYLESVKSRLMTEDESAVSARWTLLTILLLYLKALHPFMPFVTESLYQEWKGVAPEWAKAEMLMVAL